MIIYVNKKETATLVLHMAMMRKNVRNMLKKRQPEARKDWLDSFDYILASVRLILEKDYDESILNLNIKDAEMLQEFLRSYIEQAQPEADKANHKEMQEQLKILTELKNKAIEVIAS